MSAASTLAAGTRVGRVSLRVADLGREIDFYAGIVGLETLERDGDAAALGVDGTVLLELVERPDLEPRIRDETGLFHTAFRYPGRAALGDALHRAETRSELTGASDHLVSEALYLDDPEGNGVELYRDRPTSEWTVDGDGRIEMATLPLDLEPLREAAADDPGAPVGTTVGHVHLEVSNVAASQAFYVEGLGLGLKAAYGEEAIFLAAGEYHHHVGANVWNGRTEPADGLGLDWFGLVVPEDADLDGVRERLEAAGHVPTDRRCGLAVPDPDGIEVRLRSEA